MFNIFRFFILASLFLGLTVAAIAVSVSEAQTISIFNIDPVVGAGLQDGAVTAQLSDTQHGGVTVRIESSDSLIALVAPNNSLAGTPYIDVFVPNGETNATYWVQGLEDTTGTVDIIASTPGFAPDTAAVQIVQPGVEFISLVTSRDAFATDAQFQVRVGLPSGAGVNPAKQVRAGSLGLVATITNSLSGVAQLVTLPDTGQTVNVTIDPGSSSSSSNVNGGGVAFDPLGVGVTTVSVTIPGFIATDDASEDVTVTQPIVTSNTIGDVGAGLRNGSVAHLSGTQHGGVTLHIESSDTNLVLVSDAPNTPGTEFVDIVLANGQGTNVFYYVHGKENTTGTATITFSAPGFTSGQQPSEVVTPGVSTYTLDTSIDVLDPLKDVRARVGIPNAGMTGVSPAQNRRPGAPPLVVTVTSSDSSVVHFLTLTDTSDVVTTEIAPGSTVNPGTVATGGVDMDGLTGGTSTVTVSIPGFLPSGASKVVTVSQPSLTVGSIEDVGAGLRTGGEFVSLSATQHGGVTVTLTSLNPDLALLSPPSNGVPGSASIQLFFANGDNLEGFYVHGLEDTTGTAVIVASEPMFFSPDTNTVDVVTPGISILSLATTFDTLDPTEDFAVRVGVPHSSLGYVQDAQDVRPGSGGVLATVSSSDSLVALVLTQADTSDTVTILVEEDDDTTPSNVASGGVGADGLTPGMTTLSVTADGFLTMDSGSQEVTVTAPTVSLSVTDVGAGLQTGNRNGQLSASAHPGVTVTVTSLDSTLSLVSPGTGTPGSPSIDILVPSGDTFFTYVLSALEDTTGSTGIAVSAPFFAPDTAFFDVVQPGVRLAGVDNSIDVADVDDNFYAIIGKPNAGNTQISSSNFQDARAGGPGVDVTFVTSDPSVSELVTNSASGDTITLTILPSTDNTPTTVAAGGVGHDGLDEGSTVLSAASPGFISVSSAFETVFISNNNLYLLGLPLDVGSGLQTGALTAQFGISSHGGDTLRIESSDSTLARLSIASGVAGDPFIEVYVPNGTDEVNYFIHGQSGVTGEALITATSLTFPAAVETVDVVVPMVAILDLADSIDVADPSDEFIVQIGVPNAGGTAIGTPQVAGSGSPLDLTVTTSSPGIGLLETTADTSDVILLQIPAGESQTQGTVAAGGIAFAPVGPGFVTVTPSIPGFTSLPLIVEVTGSVLGVEPTTTIPLSLAQNIPNPARSATAIRFSLPSPGPVSLVVYDVSGRRVKTLVDREMPAGLFEVRWNAVDERGVRVSSGVYFYRLTTSGNLITRRMVLLR